MKSEMKVFFSEHPTMLLTLCYFFITLIGATYSYFFYSQFNINILKFADISDFLLVSILEPLSILVFIFWVFFYSVFFFFELALRKKFKGYGEMAKNKLKSKYTDPLLFTIAVIALTTFAVDNLAEKNANKIKSGSYDEYNVQIAEGNNSSKLQPFALLGSTSRFVYLYDVEKSESMVIPVENITLMSKAKASAKTVEKAEAKDKNE